VRGGISGVIIGVFAYSVGYYVYGWLMEAAAELLPHSVILAVVPGSIEITPSLGPNGLGELAFQSDIYDVMGRSFCEILWVLLLGFYLAHVSIAKPSAKAAIAKS
jgi:hypothetical protein